MEERHGVDLGAAYKNRDSAQNFTHYIAECQRRQLQTNLGACHFYSVLMDGSTDKGQAFCSTFCRKNDTLQEIQTCSRFFYVMEPSKADSDGLVECLSTALKRMGIEWSDLELLRSILILIDTQSWQESDSEDHLSEIKSALITITEHFRAPLEAKGTDLTSIIDEIEDIVEYARNYLRIGCEKYNKIWYQLYSAPDSTKWPNILLVCELLLSLPFSTAKVECLFSTLKVIKNEKRTNLSCSTLNDLLEVNTEGPTVDTFLLMTCGGVIARPVEESIRTLEKYTKNASQVAVSITDDSESDNELDLDVWDDWFSS